MSANIKSKMISFTEDYHEEYYFLKKQGNASRLVCELVRQYRLSGGGNISAIIAPKQTMQNSVSSTESYSNDIINSAKDLLE